MSFEFKNVCLCLKSGRQACLSLVAALFCVAAIPHVAVWGSRHCLRPWRYGQSWSASIVRKIFCRQVLENFNFLLLVNSLWFCALMYIQDNPCVSCTESVTRKKAYRECLYLHMTLTWVQKVINLPGRRECFLLQRKSSHLRVPPPWPGKLSQSSKVRLSWPKARDLGIRVPEHQKGWLIHSPLFSTLSLLLIPIR